MKICVLIYHKDATSMYQLEWILKCLKSISKQTFQDFDIFEMDYGKDKFSIIPMTGLFKNKNYKFFSKEYENHVHAVNFLLEKAFVECNYDVVFNINIDDHYDHTKFEKQLDWIVHKDCDLVSSNFILFNDTTQKKVFNNQIGEDIDLGKEQMLHRLFLKKNKNIIQASGACFTRKFYLETGGFVNIFPFQDLILWKKAHEKKLKMHNLYETLTFQRIHDNQI